MAKHNEIGSIGEEIAVEYLKDKGYSILERNFRRPYGEIDIIAATRPFRGTPILLFVEVKTVSHEMKLHEEGHRPEDNIHPWKLQRLSRVIQAYLLSKHYEGEWRFDVLAVYLNPETKKAQVQHMQDIVIGS